MFANVAAFVQKYHVFESGGGFLVTVYTTVQLFTSQRFLTLTKIGNVSGGEQELLPKWNVRENLY